MNILFNYLSIMYQKIQYMYQVFTTIQFSTFHQYKSIFIFKNTIVPTWDGLILEIFYVIRFPQRLNTLSLGTVKAGIDKYFLARVANLGKINSFLCHHYNNVLSLSSAHLVLPQNVVTSFSTATDNETIFMNNKNIDHQTNLQSSKSEHFICLAANKLLTRIVWHFIICTGNNSLLNYTFTIQTRISY